MEIVILNTPKDEKGLTFHHPDGSTYNFTLDIERYDEMIEWMFENTEYRFQFLGTDRIYFENTDDAMAFKLRWL